MLWNVFRRLVVSRPENEQPTERESHDHDRADRDAAEDRQRMREENTRHRMRILELERAVQTHGRHTDD